jgi:hypothetical protein
MRTAAALLATGVLLGTAGCGSGAPPTPAQVRAALAQVDAAVARHDDAAARQALDLLSQRTLVARSQGALSPQRAAAVLAAVARLQADLAPPPPPPSAVPLATGGGGDEGHGHRNGRGRGRGD